MNAFVGFVMCCLAGSAVGDYVQREAPYNTGPNDPYAAVAFNPNLLRDPSQRLFWGTQGSNQVGGTGLWATLTNKFPFLDKMFGRLEQLPTQYGPPNHFDLSTQYAAPNQYAQNEAPNPYALNGAANQLPTQYGVPQRFQPQYYQNPQFYQQVPQQAPQQLGQQQPSGRFAPFGRDVGLTDDAVIVTPPFVPPVQQPIPVPAPVPIPVPAPVPVPAAEPAGYNYDKPQLRLEYPQK